MTEIEKRIKWLRRLGNELRTEADYLEGLLKKCSPKGERELSSLPSSRTRSLPLKIKKPPSISLEEARRIMGEM